MIIAVLRTLLVVTCVTSAAAVASAPRVSMTGFGQVRIGLTIPALERVLGKKIDPPRDEEEVACRNATAGKLYNNAGLMLLDGHLARVDVVASGIRTLSGASVGDSQASVIARYGGKIKVESHKYTGPKGKYLTLYSKDRKYGIRFETDGSKVIKYYVGTAEAVQFVEGCQ